MKNWFLSLMLFLPLASNAQTSQNEELEDFPYRGNTQLKISTKTNLETRYINGLSGLKAWLKVYADNAEDASEDKLNCEIETDLIHAGYFLQAGKVLFIGNLIESSTENSEASYEVTNIVGITSLYCFFAKSGKVVNLELIKSSGLFNLVE